MLIQRKSHFRQKRKSLTEEGGIFLPKMLSFHRLESIKGLEVIFLVSRINVNMQLWSCAGLKPSLWGTNLATPFNMLSQWRLSWKTAHQLELSCLINSLFQLSGSFLIPYLICLMVAGFPVTILEIGVGQYTSQGGITAWNICPLVQGENQFFDNLLWITFVQCVYT